MKILQMENNDCTVADKIGLVILQSNNIVNQCGWFPMIGKVKCLNEWGFRQPLCTYRLNWVRRTVKLMRWHCPPDTGFDIRALAVWGWARFLSATEAPNNTEYSRVSGEETFLSLKPEYLKYDISTIAAYIIPLDIRFACLVRAIIFPHILNYRV